MVSRPFVRSAPMCCIFCSCLNVQYFTTACGILKIIQLVSIGKKTIQIFTLTYYVIIPIRIINIVNTV